eukprot:1160886-Pelagomonas_calceolata.AAC.5
MADAAGGCEWGSMCKKLQVSPFLHPTRWDVVGGSQIEIHVPTSCDGRRIAAAAAAAASRHELRSFCALIT